MRCGPPGKTTARKEDAESLFDAFDNVTSNDWSMPHSRPRLWASTLRREARTTLNGAVANFRRRAVTTQSSSSDARCGSAFSGSLEHPADDHRIRVRLPVGKHRALAFP